MRLLLLVLFAAICSLASASSWPHVHANGRVAVPRGALWNRNKHTAAAHTGERYFPAGMTADAIEDTLWQDFKQRFSRKYADDDEEKLRRNYFRESLARIDAKNKRANTEVYGITKFSDMSVDEFRSIYLGTKNRLNRPLNENIQLAPIDETQPLPQSFDWRDKNMVTEVKDQGQCGSCWAFSATESIESAWAIAGGQLNDLSPQQIVDCDNRPGDQGCNGGDIDSAFEYVISAGGLDTDAAYPYYSGDSGSADACSFNKSAVFATISNWAWATAPCNDSCTTGRNETRLLQTLVQQGPVSIAVDASNWNDYTWGTFNDCSSDAASLDHGVQLVGYYGDSKSVWNYYVRNSWNEDWGDNGYIELSYGYNDCGITDDASVPLVH